MGIIQSLATFVFLSSVLCYLYLFINRKRRNVVIQMWVTVIIGLTSGLISQLLGPILRKTTWNSISFGIILYSILIPYSIWKLWAEWRIRN